MIKLNDLLPFHFGRETIFSREDWKGVIDLVTNAKQVVSSVQDVARKLAEYAKFTGQTKYAGMFYNIFLGQVFQLYGDEKGTDPDI